MPFARLFVDHLAWRRFLKLLGFAFRQAIAWSLAWLIGFGSMANDTAWARSAASYAAIPSAVSFSSGRMPASFQPTPQSNPPSNVSTITSNFNATNIAAGNYVWFNSVAKVSGVPSTGATITISGATIQFAVNGVTYNPPVPDSVITFSPSTSTSTTTFDAAHNQWNTIVPASYTGNVFLSGLPYFAPSGLPGGINPVSWTNTFYTDTTGVSVQWQWAAAVYTSFSANNGALGVKPIDATSGSAYSNSDHAGTPENYKSYVTGGARGGGGSNWTGSYSATASVTPQLATNHAPVANAGPNQSWIVGTTVQLDGTGSYDPDGLRINYAWSMVSKPSGSAATLSSATSPTPSFVIDKAGNYTIQLIVSDGELNSAPSQVVVSTRNSPPVANAGPNQTVNTGNTVQLNGSGSSDVDGNALTYHWRITSAPHGSTAALSNPFIVNPTFVTDEKGAFVVQLIVNDGTVDSAPSQVTIGDANSPPVANAGPDQPILAGKTVQLNGSGSTDVDGDALTYAWAILSTPDGSVAQLSSTSVVNPTFLADKSGTYVIQLIVNDGTATSQASTVRVTSQNAPPIANAGPNQTATAHTTVQLDGSGSTDPNGDHLTYRWAIVSDPQGSAAHLSNPNIVNPTFVTDLRGTYVVELIVNDGLADSDPATITVSDENSAPVANPGPSQPISVGNLVQLDGSHSTDVDGDALTYSWALLSKPAGSAAVLSSTTAVQPTFVADRVGDYVIQLIVNDGTANSQPATVTISTSDVPPVAVPGANRTVSVGTQVTLNGGSSTDSNGQSLTYTWALLSTPNGSTAGLSSLNSASTSFTADLPGDYVIQLIVNDGILNSNPATVTVSTNDVPPVANPGADQTVKAGTTVQLDGTGSTDSINTPLIYKWAILSQPSGASVTLSNGAAAKPTFVPSVTGLYVVQLIVNDGYLDSQPATMTVTVNSANQPPSVSAGPDQSITLPTNKVTLNGTATDDGLPNGTLAISWTQISGPAGVVFSAPSSAVTDATFPAAGTYALKIAGNDSQLTATSIVTVTVVTPPVPVVNAGPDQTIQLPTQTVNLNGAVTINGQPPTGSISYLWTKTAGPGNVTFGNPTSLTTTATFGTAGIYFVTLSATNSAYTESATAKITVLAQHNPPTVSAGPNQVITLPANAVTLTGTVAGNGLPVGATISTLWSFVSGPGPVGFSNAASLSTTATFSAAGIYDLRLTANDGTYSGSSDVLIVVNPTVVSQSIVLTPQAAGPNVTNTTQSLTAQLKDASNAPLANATVQFVVTGANSVSGTGQTDSNGNAQFTYTGAKSGQDIVTAVAAVNGTPVVSNESQISWVRPVQPVSATSVVGKFYNLACGTALCITPSLTPALVQSFPTIDFDPPLAVNVPGNTTIDNLTRPFTDVTSDVDGNFTGTIVVQGNGVQAGLGSLFEFQAAFTGTLLVRDPGNYTIRIYNDDGMYFGIGNGATRVSGPMLSPPSNGLSSLQNYPIMGSYNTGTGAIGFDYVVNFPAAGSYPFEVDYFECCGQGLALTMAVVTANNPLGVPAATSIALTPNSPQTRNLGQPITLTAFAQDASGAAIANQALNFVVSGTNPQQSQATTDSTGHATFTYAGTNAGADRVQAIMPLAGTTGYSNEANITWNTAANQAPAINGPVTISVNFPNAANLTATVTDDGLPNGTLTTVWTQTGGTTGATILNPSQTKTDVTFSRTGTFVFTMTASDSVLSTSRSVTVNVLPPVNFPPVVSAGPEQTIQLPQDTATLNGSASDDGLPSGTLSLQWSMLSGPGTVVLSNPNSTVTQATFSAAGNYTLQLSASDSALTTNATTTVTVLSQTSPPPPACFAPPSGLVGWWPGDGDGRDLVNGNTAALGSGVSFSAGEVQRTFTLDGANSSMIVPASAALNTQSVTLNAWIFPNVLNNYQPIMEFIGASGPVGVLFGLNYSTNISPGTLVADLHDVNNQGHGLFSAPNLVPQSQWSHVALTYDRPSGIATIYLNGNSVATANLGTLNIQTFTALNIGYRPPYYTQYFFSGKIDEAGVFNRALTAAEIQGIYNAGSAGMCKPTGPQRPLVSAGPNQVITLPVNTVSLNGTVTDPYDPPPTIAWSVVSGPSGVRFGNSAIAATTATFPGTGTYVLRLTASNSAYTVTSDTTVTVSSSPNDSIAVNAGPNQRITLPANTVNLVGSATVQGTSSNSALSVSWSVSSGPAGVVFSTPNATTTSATFSAPGTYVLRLTGSTPLVYTFSEMAVTVNSAPVNQPPVVVPGPAQTIYLPQSSATLNGQVTDDGLPNKTLLVQWTVVSGPGTVTFSNASAASTQATFSSAGTYVLQLEGNDSALRTTATTSVTVVAPVGAPPTASLLLADGSEITKPTAVLGSVSNANYKLEYALYNSSQAAQNFVQFASGAGPVTGGALGTLDPTLLANGTYLVRLTATDSSGQFATATVSVIVDRNMKIGVLQLAFNDLTVPVAGIPIQVIRSYNSLDKARSGDFGNGWSLAIANIRLQKNHVLGRSWSETTQFTGIFPTYCLQPNGNPTVTVTFPDGKVYSFAAQTTPQCQNFGPISAPTLTFTQLPGSGDTLGATLVPADGGSVLFGGNAPGSGDLVDYTSATYDPTQFILTTADGTKYTLDQNLGLTSLADPNGNTLTITANGIISSTGKSIVFHRDAQNRITEVDDPSNNRLLYAYDTSGNLQSFQNAVSQTTAFGYVAVGPYFQLSSITPPGQTTSIAFNYDPNGRLIGSTDPLNGQIQYQPDIPNQRETILDRNNNATVFEYDGDGNVTKVTDALGHFTTSTYDANDNKLSETNALGKTTSYTYDDFGNRTSETDPLSHTTNYTYNARKQVLTVKDALSHVTTNTYDPNGNLTSTKDPLGNITTNTFTANGLLQTTTDATSKTTSFSYDGAGNLLTQTDALGTVTSYTYDANGNRKSQTVTRTVKVGSAQTLTTQYQYDGSNRLTQTTYPDGATSQVQYDPQGRQAATIDALNHTTTYTYDPNGRLTQTKYADNTTESATYDANGNRLTSTDRGTHTTTFTYDALNRLTKTLFVDGSFTTTTYDAIGQVTASRDANGNVTQYGYDDAGRRTTITDALNHTTTLAYDDAGNQLSVMDANNHTTSYTYDDANRRKRVTYPDTKFETTAYDPLGRVSSRTDANGKTTQFGYDNLGRLTTVTDALNQVTSYAYDQVGNRVTQTDANNHATSYIYDARGRRVQRTLPLGQIENYTYDGNGNLQSRKDFNGRTTTYSYDNLNRLLAKTPDVNFNAVPVSYTYTATGRRATMADASGTTTYNYDNRDRLTSKATPQGTLNYTYDAAGDVKTIQSSNAGGANLAYAYDVLNRLSTVTDANGTTNYGYDNVGNLQSVTYPNGVAHSYSYDTRNRLTTLGVAKGAAQLAGYSYILDAAGHRLNVTELSGRVVNYAYDDLYRLTNETIAADPSGINGAVNYTYDPVGNRQQLTSTLAPVPAGLWNYDANDRLTTIGEGYDNNGNTTVSGGLGYIYDFENHLLKRSGLTTVYDGDGNRVSKTTGNGTTKYLVDDLNPTGYAQVVDELQSGVVKRTYSWGLELISEKQTISSTLTSSYYVFDGHGSVRALTNSSGNVTDTYDYDAFGNLIHSTGSTPNLYLYSGEQFDPDLNLYYNRARYLNASTGRFWSMDTFEGSGDAPLSLHKYLYASSEPIDRIDPTGLEDLASLSIGSSIANTLNNINAIQGQALISQATEGGNAGINGLLFTAAISSAFIAFSAVVRSGAKLLSFAQAAQKGSVAIDANVLIAGLEGGELQAVDNALAGRTPTISITAAKEYLEKGNIDTLRQFLIERGGGFGPAALNSEIAELQEQAKLLGRVLKAADAAVAASAIKQGIPLLTRDSKLVNFLLAVGAQVETF